MTETDVEYIGIKNIMNEMYAKKKKLQVILLECTKLSHIYLKKKTFSYELIFPKKIK